MTRKEKYSRFCERYGPVAIFSRDWWLDAVCGGDNWDVALVEKGGSVAAAMPYFFRKAFGLTLLTMPRLTQCLGPNLRASHAKYARRLSEEKDLMTGMIDKLPPFHYFSQKFHHGITNWLPFYWRGYSQTTRYTYVLDDLTDLDGIWAGFQENIRREIRKAERRYGLEVSTDLDIETFLQINESTFKRQGAKPPYSRELVYRLDAACAGHDAKRIFSARDRQGRVHAAVYTVRDDETSYYLMGGSHPDLRSSGANSLCMWEAIKFASTVTKRFDFEGSMIESVERFFRAFGGRQVPYFQITKVNSPLLGAMLHLKEKVRQRRRN